MPLTFPPPATFFYQSIQPFSGLFRRFATELFAKTLHSFHAAATVVDKTAGTVVGQTDIRRVDNKQSARGRQHSQQIGSRKDKHRGTDHHKIVGLAGKSHGTLPQPPVDILVEEDDKRAYLRTVGSLVADMDVRVTAVDFYRLIGMERTGIFQSLAVKINDFGTSGTGMEIIAVLRNDRHFVVLFQCGNQTMGLVRLPVENGTPQRIEKSSITCLRCRQSLRRPEYQERASATASTSSVSQSPPSPRKVGSPLSRLIPAPVKNTIFFRFIADSVFSIITLQTYQKIRQSQREKVTKNGTAFAAIPFPT